MKTRWCRVAAGFVMLAMAGAAAEVGPADGGRTLFVAPARPSVIQVLQDVVRRHPDTLLLSYQAGTAPEEPVLYAWADGEWIYVPMDDYAGGRFLRRPPARIMLFGPPEILPEALVRASDWAPAYFVVPDLDHASVVNEVGRLLDFSAREWRWFAARYALDVRDAHEPLRERGWHEQPFDPVPFERPALPVPPRRRRRAPPPIREAAPVAPQPEAVPPPHRPALPPLAPPEPAEHEPAEREPVEPAPEPEPGIK